MVTHPLPYVKSAAEHQRLMWLGRTELTVVVDGAASGGALMVVEVRAQKGDAAPVHVHSREGGGLPGPGGRHDRLGRR